MDYYLSCIVYMFYVKIKQERNIIKKKFEIFEIFGMVIVTFCNGNLLVKSSFVFARWTLIYYYLSCIKYMFHVRIGVERNVIKKKFKIFDKFLEFSAW